MSGPDVCLKENIHTNLPLPDGVDATDVHLVRGRYLYYHYGCDGLDDRGWGCGYRTLQTLCSWCKLQQVNDKTSITDVPSISDVQECLITIDDKPASFRASRDWIGSVEIGLVPCKILHITSGSSLKDYVESLAHHFTTCGSPIMMGGDSDASSKGILGVCEGGSNQYLLILDPHYYGADPDQQTLIDHNMLLWRNVDSFMDNSFYNLCMPQFKYSS